MHRSTPLSLRLFAVLAVLALAALACNLPFGGEPATPAPSPTGSAPTEELYTEPAELFPTASQTAAPEQTEAPATELPPTDAPPAADQIEYNGVSFHIQPGVFSGAAPSITSPDPGEADVPGWPGPVPAYFHFDLQGYALAGPWIQPQILVYPIHAYAAVNSPAGVIAGKLDSQLRVVEMSVDSQPFLPMWNAAQVFFARPEIKPFANGKGIRYLSCYAQSFVRVDERCLFYTFQGLSTDGNYYISAIFPVDLPALHTPAVDDQWAAVETDVTRYEQYVNEMRQLLGAAQASDFTPNLDGLDALVSSLRVAPTVGLEAPPQAAFSCPGALATRLVPASRARVTFTDGTPLRVRKTAGKSADVLKTIPEGTEMFIMEGPECADEGVWWHMQTNNASLDGWVMEGDQGVYFIEPWQ